MYILYHSRFTRQFKKLPDDIKTLAEEKESIFKKDSFDPRLKTHKLSGKLIGRYAFSVNFKFRVIFKFEGKGMARFYQIGDHDIYE